MSFQLGFHVGQHAARNLGEEDVGVHQSFRLELGVLRTNGLEVVTDSNQAIHVQVSGVIGAFQHFHQRLGGVVARTQRHRGNGAIHHVSTSLNGLHQRHQSDTRRGVAVHVDLSVITVGVFDTTDDVIRRLRLEQGSHIFQGD